MKVIFLDFDGVLNSVRYHVARHDAGLDMHEGRGRKPCLDPEAIKVLNEVCGRTDAVVVVTSTWRLNEKRTTVSGWLRDAGFDGIVYAFTPPEKDVKAEHPELERVRRGHEIQSWLDAAAVFPNHRLGPVTHFVILDDDTDMEHLYNKLVKVDDQEGLTAAYVPAILEHLADDPTENVVPPVAKCPKCGAPWYVLTGFCGGCQPGGPR